MTPAARSPRAWALAVLALFAATGAAQAERMDAYRIGPRGQGEAHNPAWFKDSFLDLREDLADARTAGKRGIIVFFTQKNCNHCQAFLDTTFADPDVLRRVRTGYDVVGLDIFNDVQVTDPAGRKMPLRDYAEAEKARFTPTLVFYDADGTRLLRLVGFYPPEKFARVLDYIDGGHHARGPLSEYLRAQAAAPPAAAKLEADPSLFARPPHVLTRAAGSRPLLVVFDQPGCAACERFRERVLSDAQVRALLARFDAVMLDRGDSRVTLVDPTGRSVTPAQWARELELVYEPSLVFFDEHGAEVHRIDAETGKDRMTGSLQYVLEKAYLEHQQFLRWRRATGREAAAGAPQR